MSKYNAKKTTIDGITFDSKREAHRYSELKMLKKAGRIIDLELQPAFVLVPEYTNGAGQKIRAMVYKADFQYFDLEKKKTIVEDVKGVRTEAYKLKKKLFEDRYSPLTITEV